MQEIWVQSLGLEDPLEKEMVAHSSIPAREISGQRRLMGYSPWGSKESDGLDNKLQTLWPTSGKVGKTPNVNILIGISLVQAEKPIVMDEKSPNPPPINLWLLRLVLTISIGAWGSGVSWERGNTDRQDL